MLKKIAKLTLITCFSIYLHNHIFGNIEVPNVYVAIKASMLLALFNLIVKPILKILLLPINILTLGFFKLIIETLGLYASSYFIETFNINNLKIINVTIFDISLPYTNLSGFFAYLGTSISLAVIIYLFLLILYKKPQL